MPAPSAPQTIPDVTEDIETGSGLGRSRDNGLFDQMRANDAVYVCCGLDTDGRRTAHFKSFACPSQSLPQSGPPCAAKRSAGLLHPTSVSDGMASCSRWRSVPGTPGQPPRHILTAKRTDRASSGPAARDRNDEPSPWYHPRC
jgi:hypothetical protein